MSLSPVEQDYEAICLAYAAHNFSSINWVDRSLDYGTSSDPFLHTFSTDESIIEIMMSNDASWDEHHHHSSFPDTIEDNISGVYLPNIVKPFMNFISIHEIDSEKNLSNIEEIISLDISIKPRIVENLYIGASCSSFKIEIYQAPFHEFKDVFPWTYKKMRGIDPNIVVHKIKMYPDAKLV